mgnify:FL=1
MGQTKGIAIRIDSELLTEIENQKIDRNVLVTKAIEDYLQSKNKQTKKKTKKEENSPWSEIKEDANKINEITVNQEPKQELTKETITDNLYHEIYSTIYNTEVDPLKKQIELKNDLINNLKSQNTSMKEDKRFLYDHINRLEDHIPKKRSLFKKKDKQ